MRRSLGSIMAGILLLFLINQIPGRAQSGTEIRLWEENLSIPTYPVGPPDLNPMFYFGRTYQGAKGPMYPYPLMDRLTEKTQEKNYRAVYLENEYVKFSILPELGGRIFTGVDKTNNYDFFYRQHVIKPSLIGMVGAWISGGVEWNIPHHHRASTFMPVDYRLVENPDGSKTVWVGELEWRHRMRWIVGLTLHPHKSYIEATIKLFNRTPVANSMLYFANVAVHVNPDYQVIFPPGTQFGTQHAKREFVHWPIGQESYAGVDYKGVDISWWKNHPRPVSIFAWNYEDDFFGGYDHGKQAGVCHFSNHFISPGKKFFEFANGPEGTMWDKILTDTDGPYLELMAGAYSDNQPDYSWTQPYEVKTVKQYWYPIRELGGIKNANLDAAMNLELKSGNWVRLAFNTTSEFTGAQVQLFNKGQKIWSGTMDISPEKPFVKELQIAAGTSAEDLRALLLTREGRELVSYQAAKPKSDPLPNPVEPPPPPRDIKTNEELYLAGLRLEQFYNPSHEPYPYYEEALRRDPGDTRVNTALGILYLKRGMYKQAEERFQKSLDRLTRNYTSPKDGEAFYYLGMALKAQGKWDESVNALEKATWSSAWCGPSNLALAEILCRLGDSAKAMEHVEKSISANSQNTKALNLKATLLRKSEHYQEADSTATLSLELDPLDFWAGREKILAQGGMQQADQAWKSSQALESLMRGEVQSYLELAADYANCGLWDDSISILSRLLELSPDKNRINPMAHYDLGFYWNRKGDSAQALAHYQQGGKMSADLCFPFRLESIAVLEEAIQLNPGDPRSPYYLGNLLFDLQPEKAIQSWEKALSLDPAFPFVHRNLAMGYWRTQKDPVKGTASMEKAVAANPRDPRYFLELDTLYEAGGKPHAQRLAMLEKNHAVVTKRDDSLLREIALLILAGNYDRAITLLSNRHFHLWEGGDDEASNVHNLYMAAHLLRGQKLFKAGKHREALEDFEAALEYPDPFEIGRPYRGGRDLIAEYFTGTAYEALGDKAKALSFYEKTVAHAGGWSDLRYYQGLAYRHLGKSAQAGEIFAGLIRYGNQKLQSKSSLDFFAKFGAGQNEAAQKAEAHYLIALGQLGKGTQDLARKELETALQLDLNHWGAQNMLATLK